MYIVQKKKTEFEEGIYIYDIVPLYQCVYANDFFNSLYVILRFNCCSVYKPFHLLFIYVYVCYKLMHCGT